MKKTCLLIVFLCAATIGFSQITTSTYDFEGLALAPINGQDNWEVKSSHSQVNNGSICPPVPGTELHPELFNATSSGLYTGSKALQNVNFSFALHIFRTIDIYFTDIYRATVVYQNIKE